MVFYNISISDEGAKAVSFDGKEIYSCRDCYITKYQNPVRDNVVPGIFAVISKKDPSFRRHPREVFNYKGVVLSDMADSLDFHGFTDYSEVRGNTDCDEMPEDFRFRFDESYLQGLLD